MKTARSVWLRRMGLGALGLVLLGALAFVALRTGPLAPVKVQVVKVTRGQVSPQIFGIGQVEARLSWQIGPTTAGRVKALGVDVGQTVEAGQVLAEMDPVDMDQRVQALEATLARAASAEDASSAQLRDAQARQRLASTNLRRNQDLADQHFISAGALETRGQELTSADAGVQAAQANLAGAQQELRRLRAERDALVQQRGNLRLLAPAGAVVSSRDAEVGTTVVAGQSVVKLMDPASLWVRLRVDQGRSAGLQTGLPASIQLRSRPDEAFAGKVQRLEPLADSVTEERIAMVAFDTVPAGLSVGEMAEVTLDLPPSADGLVLPNAALQQRDGASGVWRLGASSEAGGDRGDHGGSGALAFVPVTVVAQGLDGTLVLKPLTAGQLRENDQVVLYSQTAIGPNTRITVVDRLLPAGAAK